MPKRTRALQFIQLPFGNAATSRCTICKRRFSTPAETGGGGVDRLLRMRAEFEAHECDESSKVFPASPKPH
jgi:hypothetical protein